MVKISALPPMTSGSGDDELPAVDDSVGTTKKTSFTVLKEWLQSLAGWISTAMLSDASVTPTKLATGASSANVATTQTTTSGSYTDLATVGPTVTVTIGANGIALVAFSSYLQQSLVSGNTAGVSFAMSGANTQSASDGLGIVYQTWTNSAFGTYGTAILLTGLNSGSTTFTLKYRSSGGGTSSFSNRRIGVTPL